MQTETRSKYLELDCLLAASDAESSDWNDGYDSRSAAALLKNLSPAERGVLFGSTAAKAANWRRCLVSILHPAVTDEGEALIGAIWDDDPDIAFAALHRSTFYCGILTSEKKGVHEHPRIRVAAFLQQLAIREGIQTRIEAISSESHPKWVEEFRLLTNVLVRARSRGDVDEGEFIVS